MSSKFNALAAAFAGIAIIVTTGAALASPATATTNVNVRSGPGPSFGIVDTVKRGEFVDLVGCEGRWCYIDRQGSEGWVSADYLKLGAVSHQPSVSLGFGYGALPTHSNDYPRPPRPGYYDQGGYDQEWGGRRSWDNDSDWTGGNSRDNRRRPREWY